ncbi:DenI|uniref:Uncharacterized protein n=1 Tax=Dendrosporobacter quercicolus TaxID=146817 RepID=A0A1G9P014_9FIRM|nr:hypothetical protein [Dendrosporobacter quercicolus]NSL47499.1 DenI [Dendrosporobacter quercicolus DSM 1736]SDL91989.1 hypothetical protein SAMN04488502_1011179 [Dendrosporobacter quercicolus]
MRVFHQITAVIALLTICTFLLSSVTAELIGEPALIAGVKKLIVYGLSIVLICMPLLVASGRKLAAYYPGQPLIEAKTRRMKWIGVNGIVFLTPLAFILDYFAQNAQFDLSFFAFQILEIVCGGVNIFLFSHMFMDGKQISRSKITLES